jgi:putative methyltransferase (TIGR04325 family)
LNENSVIIDFGGGLGGNYLANQSLLDKKNITYIIIEQSSFVNQGKLIANEFNLPIQFIESIWEFPVKNVKILVCSGVLQYVEDWQNVVSDLLACKPQYILVDRMPLTDSPTSILVQENEGYYNPKVSYPVRILNREEFLREFEGYTIIKEWESDFDPTNHLGFLLVNN